VRVFFAGSGGSVVTRNRCCPSILVNEEVLIDCGSGSLRNLRSQEVELTGIEEVLLTHSHADHISDLVPLLWAMRCDLRTSPLLIAGPMGIKAQVASLLELYHTPKDWLNFPIEFREIEGEVEFGYVATCRVNHTIPAVAYRISDGGGLCYSGDTRFSPELVSLAKGCEVLVHESVFLEEQRKYAAMTGHSTPKDAARVAVKADVNKMILFHLSPRYESMEKKYLRQASAEFNGDLEVAQDLMKIEV